MAWSATPLRQYPEDHDFGKAFNEDIVGKVMWICVLSVTARVSLRARAGQRSEARSQHVRSQHIARCTYAEHSVADACI